VKGFAICKKQVPRDARDDTYPARDDTHPARDDAYPLVILSEAKELLLKETPRNKNRSLAALGITKIEITPHDKGREMHR